MKKSNSLILIAILVMVGSLIIYNFKLKAVYDSKSYRNPYNEMEFTSMSGVEKLNLRLSGNSRIQIKQGDKEGIWVGVWIKDKVEISVDDDKLNVELSGSQSQMPNGSVIIITNRINDINVNQNERKDGESYAQGRVVVSNYNIDKLNLHQSGTTNVQFAGMKIDTLNAVLGKETGYSVLQLSTDTRINIANYDIGARGDLRLSNANVRINNNGDSANTFPIQNDN